MTDKLDFDPYELLALSEECSQQDVIRAYRKTALIWHPDKNPSQKDFGRKIVTINPVIINFKLKSYLAQQMFLKVAKALEILCDPAAKAALDRLRHAHRINVERNKHLDERRRKLKEG
ncbi:unnamed protein product [Soboliphyme baturini]|uniref:J domain-containing protein n=1 Tax=Soboliphyme baturini TaxID=241478 RepID=A0A183IRY7_9BILA|nr:unnamed protein product [Soboliphyme baturini]